MERTMDAFRVGAHGYGPYYQCRVCGFKRYHRYLSGGIDGLYAKFRVQLHMLLQGHK